MLQQLLLPSPVRPDVSPFLRRRETGGRRRNRLHSDASATQAEDACQSASQNEENPL